MASFPEFVITRNISSQFVIACDLGINAHHHANIHTTDRAAISETRKVHRTVHVRMAPARSQHVAPRGILRSSRPRLMQLPPLVIPTPLKLSLLTWAPDWRRPRRRPRCCCRSVAVVCPYARRQNAWPHAETAGDCKRRCWTLLYTTWFSCRSACSISCCQVSRCPVPRSQRPPPSHPSVTVHSVIDRRQKIIIIPRADHTACSTIG